MHSATRRKITDDVASSIVTIDNEIARLQGEKRKLDGLVADLEAYETVLTQLSWQKRRSVHVDRQFCDADLEARLMIELRLGDRGPTQTEIQAIAKRFSRLEGYEDRVCLAGSIEGSPFIEITGKTGLVTVIHSFRKRVKYNPTDLMSDGY